MKCIALLFCSLLLPANGQEKPLSELDRELLLEKLKEVQGTSDSTVKGRYGVALSAFRKARESSAAAHELYLNCIEKVRFEDQLRKASEFRDWKKRHKERSDSPAFRLALRHQLNWLVLTLEAAQVDDISVLSTRGVGVLESIIRDAEDLKGQDQLLRSDPLSSIFADAYSVGTIEIDTWPKSPLDIADLYENVILPPLRTPKTLDSLRKAWLKRVEHEGNLLEKWTSEASGDRDRKPAFEKWLIEERPKLTWAMEVDLFEAGDQRGGALRMLEHLKKHLTHKSAPKWIAQFTTLVEGGTPEGETQESE
ncbi:MAG: hypothetical protein P8Q54_14465 [Akkermansiaceae bacterium]|nr:hypothetical protein [Akkermansiaceae bacterium]MDG1364671.1 hypothetical protein [Akkermansiaceae bacterium]